MKVRLADLTLGDLLALAIVIGVIIFAYVTFHKGNPGQDRALRQANCAAKLPISAPPLAFDLCGTLK